MKAKLTVEVGAINRSKFRKFLEKRKAVNGIEYTEIKNLLDSEFIISGDMNIIIAIKNVVRKFEID